MVLISDIKNRAIRYYDSNIPSGLTQMILDAESKGIQIIPFDTLPETAKVKTSEIMFINPIYNSSPSYLERIRQCIKTHRETRFFLYVPILISEERTKIIKLIGTYENLEVLSTRPAKKIKKLINEDF